MNCPSLPELLKEFSEIITDGEPQISPGDSYDLDSYVLLLEQLGYQVSYENLVDDYGFIAQVSINGDKHALWEGGISSINHVVKEVQNPLQEFDKRE